MSTKAGHTLTELATEVLALARAHGLTIGTIESCTGGLVSGALTAIAGSSDVVMGGLVTYSNEAKTALARVPAALIEANGAVSEPVARAMAEGGQIALGVDLAVSVTGVAGPGGGSAAKPVGLVHFAVANASGTVHREMRFGPLDRTTIRSKSVIVALEMLREAAQA
ncbi:MAG: CinA family protein [Bosea sp. (in: a-proteobacteria)]